MLFIDAIIYNVLDPVGCAFQLFNDLPWAGIRLADFPYNTSLLIRLDGPSREDIITNRIDFGIWSCRINVLAVPGAMMVDECLSDGS